MNVHICVCIKLGRKYGVLTIYFKIDGRLVDRTREIYMSVLYITEQFIYDALEIVCTKINQL